MLGKIVTATKTHALMMAPNMREVEKREVRDACGRQPAAALIFELDRSSVAWAWIVNGEVACMFGIVAPTLLDSVSYPWFLTTPLVETHARQFARACKTLLPELLEAHPRLVGMVDSRHTLSVRWLQWLGARIGPAMQWGVAGAPFHHFELGA
jgi:hypothetical protein